MRSPIGVLNMTTHETTIVEQCEPDHEVEGRRRSPDEERECPRGTPGGRSECWRVGRCLRAVDVDEEVARDAERGS